MWGVVAHSQIQYELQMKSPWSEVASLVFGAALLGLETSDHNVRAGSSSWSGAAVGRLLDLFAWLAVMIGLVDNVVR